MWTSVALLPRKTESYGETSDVCVVEGYYYVAVRREAPMIKASRCQNLITHVSVKRVLKGDHSAITGSFNS